MQFDIVHLTAPSLIDIKNLNKHATAATDPSDIILKGTGLAAFTGAAGIENPIGETRILNTRGDIKAFSAGVEIRTQTLGDPDAPVLPKDFERIAGRCVRGQRCIRGCGHRRAGHDVAH